MKEVNEHIPRRNGCFIKIDFAFLGLVEPYSNKRNPIVKIKIWIATCIFWSKIKALSIDPFETSLVIYLKAF